jgi:prephenate dehydrogenase
VAHRVCVCHKQTNFTKHVNAARATAATRNEAIGLFREICYAKEHEQVRAAIEKIRHLLPLMSDYLDREITEKLPLFSETFRGDAFTLGFGATSIAESAHSMIKRYCPPRVSILCQIRESYTRAYRVKALAKQPC